MRCGGASAVVTAVSAAALYAQTPPADLLPEFRAGVNSMLRRIPDYTCRQTIARSVRVEPGGAFRPLDTLRLHVGWVGGQERYGTSAAAGFEERELRDIVSRGLTSNGNFAGHVRHIFLSAGATFTARGAEQCRGRTAQRYDYEIPVEYSRYKIRARPEEAEVGIRGSFWFDPGTLDLVRIEVHADEIPPELKMARFSETVDYERTAIGDSEILAPVVSELTVVTPEGDEFRNQSTFHECRRFSAESNLRYDLAEATRDRESRPAPEPAPAPGCRMAPLPASVQVDLVLDRDIDLASTSVGDPVTAGVANPVAGGERPFLTEGSVAQGRVVRLDRSSQPFDHYVVGLEFQTVNGGGQAFALFATMQDAGPAAGLLRVAKRLNPEFTKRRTGKLDILVREKPRGEGVLHWDAKRPVIRRGLKMRWWTFEPEPGSARECAPGGQH